jgi:hypothetical protein
MSASVPFDSSHLRPAEMTPAERATAVAAILAAALLRVLHADTFPPPGDDTNSQEIPGESA